MKFRGPALVLVAITALALNPFSAEAQPCYSGFKYRVPVELDNSSSDALSNYEVNLSLNTNALIQTGKMQSLGQDIRFLDASGNNLDYWIESGINTSKTSLWVQVSSIRAYGKDTIYMYYGNSTATAKSNADATFHLVDEFNGSTLNSSRWSACGSGTISLSRGSLNLTSNSSTASIETKQSFSQPVLVELTGVSSSGGGNAVMGQLNSSGSGYGMLHNGSVMQLASVSNSSCISATSFGSSNSTALVGNWSFVWTSGKQEGSWSGQTLNGAASTTTRGSSTTFVLGNTGSYGTLKVDYLRVRGYAATVPSVSLGSEQNMDFTLSASYESPLCVGGDLKLSATAVAGGVYSWTGPNSFSSNLQNPVITGVSASDAGRFDLTVDIPNGCASKSTTVNVNITAKAVGGSVAGTQTVCSGSNYGILSLSSHSGNVLRWDSSGSANGPWKAISNTGLTQSYRDLKTTTYFRAMVTNGNCSVDSSSVAKISVTAPSNAGSIAGADTVCSGSNSGVLTVSGYTGNILRWETSLNGNLWTTITNKGTSQSFVNLNNTTYFRAVVQNGICAVDYSAPAIIAVDAKSQGGTISGSTNVCPNVNDGDLILLNRVGSVVRWESKTASGSWTAINQTSDTLSFNNLSSTTTYRALVKNGSCGADLSATATITVLDGSAAGTITGSDRVCVSGNSGKIEVTNYKGAIAKWQKRTTGSWVDVSNTSASNSYYNLSETTDYRAVISNNGCKPDTTAVATVQVDALSDGGYVSGDRVVCEGANQAQLIVNATVGEVSAWQYSTTGYMPWSSMSNSATDTFELTNITASLYYRAVVKNGVCAEATSAYLPVEVTPKSDAGKLSKNLELCAGTNFGVIKVNNHTGSVVDWLETSDVNGSWTSSANTSEAYEAQNLTENLYLKVVVKNGVCEADTSDLGIVEVATPSDAGKIYGDESYCSIINDGEVYLKDLIGEVINWESSTDGGNSWTEHVSDKTNYTYKNVSTTTLYRAVVRNKVCPNATSDIVQINVADASVAGTLNTDINLVCELSNTGTIHLAGNTGNVVKWQSKTNGQWDDVLNSSNTLNFFDIKAETAYRAIVKSDFCEADTTKSLSIYLSSESQAGTISGISPICSEQGSTTLQVNAFNGSVRAWQQATSENGPWTDVASNTETFEATYMAGNSYYRTLVKNGACPEVISEPFKLEVFASTNPGILSGLREVCEIDNEGVIELTGNTGEILDWEILDDNGEWKSLNYTGDLYWFEKLNAVTTYRAKVKNGLCPEAYTPSHLIEVNPLPVVKILTQNLCEKQMSVFTSTTTIDKGNVVGVNWQFSDGYTSTDENVKRLFTTYGKYDVRLEATSNKNCKSIVTESVVIGELPLVGFRLSNGIGQNTSCLNSTSEFENLTTHSNKTELEYAWDFGNGQTSTLETPTLNYVVPGSYDVVLTVSTRNNTCSNSYSNKITVLEEIKPDAGIDIEASLGIEVQLNAKGNISYQWEPAEFLNDATIANPIARITEPTMFTVVGTDYYGCTSSDSVWVNVIRDHTVRPNNVITPDGNNENDVWVVQNIENYPNNSVSVFDRWGREVFRTDSYQSDWGATDLDGKGLMDGTYYYVIEFPEINKVMKGAITVVNNK